MNRCTAASPRKVRASSGRNKQLGHARMHEVNKRHALWRFVACRLRAEALAEC